MKMQLLDLLIVLVHTKIIYDNYQDMECRNYLTGFLFSTLTSHACKYGTLIAL